MIKRTVMLSLLIGGVASCTIWAQPKITVDVTRRGGTISPTMWGIFLEDINFGADGGLYAELVKNRSFEFDRPLRGWKVLGRPSISNRVFVLRDEHRPKNPRFIRVQVREPSKRFGLNNEGFRGMGVCRGQTYRFSVEARAVEGAISGLRVELAPANGDVLATGHVKGFESDWGTYRCELISSGTEAKASLNIWFEGTGVVDLDMVSLFPEKIWKGRANGLRADLVQMLADLKPGFFRFPGGCIVEGFDLSQRYQWKNTIGDPNQRVVTINRWNFELKHRPTPDYYQSFGLGFYEYFLLAEDIGAEPMPIINCGMACQFNSAELVPMDQLGPYVQDALDLIEFANGSTDSRWGEVRAKMGHPKPFGLKMIGIGNEQWGPQYIERYKVFAKAIKAKYPEMQLIAATGSDATIFPNGRAEIDYLWSQWRKLKPEFVDEHFYRRPEWFLENTDWYDNYDRSGPKLFVGEYASQSVGVGSPDNRNSLKCALYEAAFMTGMERNADLVRMSCYAPLFGHEEAWQWRPDLIWFDNLNVYGSANYYVQKLFSLHRGTHQLTAQLEGIPSINAKAKALNVSSVWDQKTGQVILKAVNVTNGAIGATIDLKNAERVGPKATVIVLSSEKLSDENSLAEPKKIYPKETLKTVTAARFSYSFQPYSLTVLRIPVR